MDVRLLLNLHFLSVDVKPLTRLLPRYKMREGFGMAVHYTLSQESGSNELLIYLNRKYSINPAVH